MASRAVGDAARDAAALGRLRARILASTSRFWRPSDGGAAADSSAQRLFNDLVDEGEIRQVCKGLYWRGLRTPLGMSGPPVEELVRELAPGPGTGPAGLSAANALRLSTQVPRRMLVAVPLRPPADVLPISFISRAARTGRRTAGLSSVEVALLEVLEGWETLLDVSPVEGWMTLRSLVDAGQARPRQLAQAAKTERAVVRARLAALLRECGAAAEADRVPEADPRTRKAALRSVPVATE